MFIIFKYQFCGPGTKLKERLERGDKGINELDRACKEHDIVYSEHKGGQKRRAADEVLANKAWKRFKSSDASVDEKLGSLAVAGIMKAKAKLGLGIDNNVNKQMKLGLGIAKKYIKMSDSPPSKRKITKTKSSSKKVLTEVIKDAENILNVANPLNVDEASKLALIGALASVKKQKVPKKIMDKNKPRVIPVPKVGGMLPLVPIFAGLSAIGALMGGSASIANAVYAASKAKESLDEANRHNKMMEAIALGKNVVGDGMFLKPYRKGLGIYLAPYSKSKNL